MKPYNKTNINSPEIISSNTVVWEGPTIPCIDLCTGENTTDVIAKIGNKICETITDIETLKTLDYTCIVDKLDYTGQLIDPDKFSLKLLFQLLLDNDCKLKDLIENINGTTSSEVNLNNLQLKCITNEILNLCGQIPDNLEINKLAQALINILCDIQDEVADILIRLITIESKISALGDPGSGGYVEPNITSCLSVVPTVMHEHIVNITDKKICDLEELIGSQSIIDTTIANQCLSDYVGNSEINFNATSLADTMKNKEVILCDLQSRIKLIEDSCCSFGCEDIKIGFTQNYDVNSNLYTLEFTYGAGTNIPLVFLDCGSTFIITDWKGVTKTINNTSGTLTNGSTFVISLVGSGLDVAKPLNLEIKTCFTNTQNGLICKDCFGGTLDASSTSLSGTCWSFNIPKTDVLGCGNKNLKYSSIELTSGNYTLDTIDTSVGGVLSLPSPINSSPLSNIINCGSSILMTIQNQSITTSPEIKLLIANTSPSLYINIVGTLNSNCLC